MPAPKKLLLSLTCLALVATTADAQYYRSGRSDVVVRAPGVGVDVGPGGVDVRAPFFRYSKRRVPTYPGVVPPGAVAPGVGVGVHVAPVPALVDVTVAKPTVVIDPTLPQVGGGYIVRELSEAELASLGEADLLAALANASAALEADLATLNGGDGWRRYLSLPSGVAAGKAEVGKLTQLLARFDSVARDPQFAMIAGLRSFTLMRTTLRVSVDRFSGTAMTAPNAPVAPSTPKLVAPSLTAPSQATPPKSSAESLPLPKANAAPAGDGQMEKSVLAR